MSVIAGAARLPLDQVSTHAAFPGLCQLPNRDLLRVWRDAPQHSGGSNGRIFAQRLTENMVELEEPRLIFDWADDLRDPSVSVSDDGSRIYMTFFSWSTDGCRSWFSVSEDGGATFNHTVQIGIGSDTMAITAPVVESTNGTLLAFGYGRWAASETLDSTFQFRSGDGGATWSAWTRMANGPAAGRHYQEPTVIRLSNGALLAALRYGTRDQIGVQASWDEGDTWSLPTPKFTGWGRPNLLELSTGPVVAIYRSPTLPHAALYRTSLNRGGTWSSPTALNTPLNWMSYAAMVETAPGLAVCVLGTEDANTLSRLEGLHLLDWA